MDTQLSIDLGQIAHELHLPHDRVQRTVELLDDGNTVPFITRYRREQTRGLDEEQIRHIDDAVKRRRQLLERKQTILKTIESQGKLTPELQREIEHAHNLKRLEDLYLPYKPKKQTLATVARERGLEPLTLEILNADIPEFESRLVELVDPEKGLPTTTDVLEGIQHIAAEKISERADLRGRLRRIFFRSGLLICSKIEKPPEAPTFEEIAAPAGDEEQASAGAPEHASEGNEAASAATEPADVVQEIAEQPADGATAPISEEAGDASAPVAEPVAAAASEPAAEPTGETTAAVAEEISDASPEAGSETPTATLPLESTGSELPQGRLFEKPTQPVMSPVADKKKKKKKKKKLSESAFKDYFNFREPLTKLPPHRTLAINRGERANVLRVKIEVDVDAMLREAEEVAVPPEHPHKEFLRLCVRDALCG